jgi:tetratricopeptide (TPR) repeat protein
MLAVLVAFVFSVACAQGAEKPKAEEPKADDPAKQLMAQLNYRLELAEVNLKYGDLAAAQGVLEQAIKLAEESKAEGETATLLVQRARFTLGTIYQKEEKWAEAEKQYETLEGQLKLPSDQLNVAVLLSQTREKQKKDSEAEKPLLALTNDRMGLALRQEGWKYLADFWKRHPEQLASTIAVTEAITEKDPTNVEALERLAQIYTDIKPDAKKAAACMDKLLALTAKNLDARLRLAALYERQKEFDKALKLYQELQPEAPKALSWDISLRMAVIMLRAGRKDEAVAKVEKDLLPKAQTALETASLASFYASAELPQKAEDAFVKAASLSQSPDDVAACMLAAAESSRKRKDYAKAEQYVRALIKQYKDNKQVKTKANTELVKIYEEQGKLGDLNIGE